MMAPRAGMSPAPRTRGSDPRPGRDGASRGSDPRDGGRPYSPGGNGNGNGRGGGGNGNGNGRGGGGNGNGNGRGGGGNGNGNGGRPYANGGDPYDGHPPSRARGQSNARPVIRDGAGGPPDRAPRRSMRELARDVSRTMSRQISTMLPRRSARPQSGPRGAGGAAGVGRRSLPPRTSLPADEVEKLRAQAYRRSRIRLVARKWRLGRVQRNPILYLAGVLGGIVLAVATAAGGGFGVYYAAGYYQLHVPDIQAIANLHNAQNSTIYDRNGIPIAVIRGNSEFNFYVPLAHINPKVQWATIDTEDNTFYTNVGINFLATIRAATVDVKAGGAAQGASTITQQLVKNIVLKDSTKSYTRKINEAILAYGVTQNYTKAQILEYYLNTVDYSGLYQGIESAARYYYHISPIENPDHSVKTYANEQLDWAQTALLVALPNNPTIYYPPQYTCSKAPCPIAQWDDPYVPGHECNENYFISGFGPDWYTTHGHEWLDFCRAKLVLQDLLKYGCSGGPSAYCDADSQLTLDQYNAAVPEVQTMLEQQKIYDYSQIGATHDSGLALNRAPHFVDYVVNQLADQFGISSLETAGYKVYTTLDLNFNNYIQKDLQYYIQQPHANPWYGSGYEASLASASNANDGAVVAIDPHNGDILGMVGSVDYNDKDPTVAGAVNVTTRGRSMGSAFKPLVYATAFQMGWTPGTMMKDEAVCFPQTAPGADKTPAAACAPHYVPQNYSQNFFNGTVPVRYALGNSLNIPATEAMSFVGDAPDDSQTFITMMQRLGIGSTPGCPSITADNMGPTTALGTQDVCLLDITSAYGVFADAGKRAPARAILRVVDASGNVAYSAPAIPPAAQVISPETAYMMTSILTDNMARAQDFGQTQNPIHWEPSRGENYNVALAAKTGTSSGPTGPRDILTIGYTPYLAVGAWIGNANSADMASDIIGVAGAGYVFHDVMLWALKNYHWPASAQFPIPPDMALGTFNCDTGLAPYKGQPTAQCNQNPLPYTHSSYTDNKCFTTDFCYLDIYEGASGFPKTRPDTDWYIRGQEPSVS
ncbi:MAG TPA: transglycosylase domain-containing protein [Ktedonobacterales bacterium]